MTKLPEIRERSVVRFSVIPSAKYSWSGSRERFSNGRTTIDSRDVLTAGLPAPRGEAICASASGGGCTDARRDDDGASYDARSCRGGGRRRGRGCSDRLGSHRIGSHRPGDVLDELLAHIVDRV